MPLPHFATIRFEVGMADAIAIPGAMLWKYVPIFLAGG